MSNIDYKGQATRLATYLSHIGLNLSHSQSLEAIAAIHKAKDWNTLSAQQNRAAVVTTIQSAGVWDELELTAPECGMRVFLSYETLTRHLYLLGKPGAGSTILLNRLIEGHVAKSGACLIVDGCGDLSNAPVGSTVAQFGGNAAQVTLDFDSYTPDEIAEAVISLIPAGAANPGADYYRSLAKQVITAICQCLRDEGVSVDTAAISEAVQNPAASFVRWAAREDEAGLTFRQFTKKSKEGWVVNTEAVRSSLGGMVGRLALLQTVLSRTPNVKKIDLLARSKTPGCTWLSVSGFASGGEEHIVMNGILRVLEARRVGDRSKPLLIGIHAPLVTCVEQLATLLRRASAANAVVVIAGGASEAMLDILKDVGSHVLFPIGRAAATPREREEARQILQVIGLLNSSSESAKAAWNVLSGEVGTAALAQASGWDCTVIPFRIAVR